DLGSHDEIVLVKSFDLLRAQRDSRVAPAEIDVRMMALRLGSSLTLSTKFSASRKLRNRKLRAMRWASSRSSHCGAWEWSRSASSRVSGGMPPRQGVQVFSTRVSAMASSHLLQDTVRAMLACAPEKSAFAFERSNLRDILAHALAGSETRPLGHGWNDAICIRCVDHHPDGRFSA